MTKTETVMAYAAIGEMVVEKVRELGLLNKKPGPKPKADKPKAPKKARAKKAKAPAEPPPADDAPPPLGDE